ncbi:hypothetical protein EN925_05650 [Mesorhizobium sp. M7A.F.Ca.US.006.04.2.1]|uniref:hypothetical protein n=1 Tax=unclassified Mesorhizobium TaxID=325217 RepID=UPI000FC9A6B1|nr:MULTISPECIES: hypothetical protein [unclassified Mesorhizobium]RUX69952.1 hypothetical protein EN990_33180 [Mesorhizobium sp. M7A.F.Ca.US.005.03.1.1]RUY16699.1 hypothetical protein EN991_10475 [Mesorhizobium sp. M7A.F.Ca.US.005.03.2.1]RUY28961.1 hypothetical protein EN979_11740 [Mesorhizobium sp. M7A.F.Ca.US.001.04.2.1]RUY41467.1 hypothetical protein EN978_15205 [Mesorhizobium sp. M7A.F.Ca.US.001.04.1.1]RVA94652.1 hypothetical protein EN925_05650 [Mesorhizobium sp. M7A.F.Ca.US.006.04.2.1]
MYKLVMTASAFLVFTTPSFAIDSTFVHSLRADNGDFETPGEFKGQHSMASEEAYGFQTGSIGIAGGASNSKCIGVSPREYDPLGPDCRN